MWFIEFLHMVFTMCNSFTSDFTDYLPDDHCATKKKDRPSPYYCIAFANLNEGKRAIDCSFLQF